MPPQLIITGVVDMGLKYEKVSGQTGKLTMESGQENASRINLIALEQINPDLSVEGFLEIDTEVDSGQLKGINKDQKDAPGSTLFNAQSTLSLIHREYGQIGFGHLYSFSSNIGQTGWAHRLDPFESYLEASTFATASFKNLSNTIYWISPRMSGLQLGAMYSFNGESQKEVAGDFSKNNRFWNVAANYEQGPWSLVMTLDGETVSSESRRSNPLQFRVGGSLDAGWAKFFLGYNYEKNSQRISVESADGNLGGLYAIGTGIVPDALDNGKGIDKHAVNLGVQVPLGNGTFAAQYQYLTGKTDNPFVKSLLVGESHIAKNVYTVGYFYPLSKRTHLYGVVTDSHGSKGLTREVDPSSHRVLGVCGMVHKF